MLARTLACCVRERANLRGPQLQRLIAVNPAGEPHTDYAIMKQVHQLRAAPELTAHTRVIATLNSAINFSAMAEGENLYIVSHGASDTGDIKTIETDKLIKWINATIPSNFGKIVVLSCYGGMPKNGGDALAERIADGIKHRGHTVEGALGFSFGTAEFSSTGHSSVLAEGHRVFYEANDVDAMAAAWGDLFPTNQDGVLKSACGINFATLGETIRSNIRYRGARVLTVEETNKKIRGLMATFKSMVKGIEHDLKQALADTAGDTVAEKIATLETIPPRRTKKPMSTRAWEGRLAAQYKLFNDYYLWTDPGASFASFTS